MAAEGGGVGKKWGERAVKFVRFDATRSDVVEIVIGDVVVRAGGDVEAARLVEVIRAVRRA